MSNQLFNEVGLLPPMSGGVVANGATIFSMSDVGGLGGTARLKGEVVLLSPLGGNSDTLDRASSTNYTTFETVGATSATTGGLSLQMRAFGLCLEDIAAGSSGLVMVRGTALGRVEDAGANINPAGQTGLVAIDGAGTIPGNLVSFIDAGGAGSYFKVVALYRGITVVQSGPGVVVLRPVDFNGVEGFFSGELP